MELEEVRQLVKLVEESGIEALELTHKGTTIRIQKGGHPHGNGAGGLMAMGLPPAVAAAPMPAAAPPAAAPAAAAVAHAAAASPAEVAATEVDRVREKWKEVRSPIVGTFYRAPAPFRDFPPGPPPRSGAARSPLKERRRRPIIRQSESPPGAVGRAEPG